MFDDLPDVMLEAQAEFAEIFREVMQEMVMPQVVRTAKLKWAQMSGEEKERFKAERPQEYQAFMEALNE